MAEEILTRLRFNAGCYEGTLQANPAPGIEAMHHGKVVAVAHATPQEGRTNEHRISVHLPAEVMGEGVQVIALRSTTTGDVLDRITIMAGAALDEDIRAELALVRDELEVLKRAFRRHCVETGQD